MIVTARAPTAPRACVTAFSPTDPCSFIRSLPRRRSLAASGPAAADCALGLRVAFCLLRAYFLLCALVGAHLWYGHRLHLRRCPVVLGILALRVTPFLWTWIWSEYCPTASKSVCSPTACPCACTRRLCPFPSFPLDPSSPPLLQTARVGVLNFVLLRSATACRMHALHPAWTSVVRKMLRSCAVCHQCFA